LYQDYLKKYENNDSQNDLFYYVYIQTENTFGKNDFQTEKH